MPLSADLRQVASGRLWAVEVHTTEVAPEIGYL
jgi:hypothetical protein